MPSILLAALACLALFWGQPAGPQTRIDLPDTPVGQRARAWLDALESADDAGLEAMMRENFAPRLLEVLPIQEHLQLHREIRNDITEIVSLQSQRPDRLSFLCRTTDGWASLDLSFQEQPPHLIIGIGTRAAEDPDTAAMGPAADDAELATALAAYLDNLTDDEFSGAVLIARNGTPVFSAARGEASKRFHAPNTLDTKFNLGSANKMQTAIAINQLAEQGKLKYTDTVGDLLPDYPNEDVKARVTVHHLLTHTGGTGNHFKPEFFEQSKLNYRTLADYIPLIADNGVAFEPGSQMAYSNAGFLILGRIVEVVSGENYYDYIRNHVTGPAGMTNTDCYDVDIPVENLAEGYVPADEYDQQLDQHTLGDTLPNLPDSARNWRSNQFLHSIKGGPAGGGYSTVIDLNKLADAFMHNTLVSNETRALMTTTHTRFGRSESTAYGYGLVIETQPDGLRSFGHGGGFPGIRTAFTIVPDRNADGYYTIAIMTNAADHADRVYEHALRLLPRK